MADSFTVPDLIEIIEQCSAPNKEKAQDYSCFSAETTYEVGWRDATIAILLELAKTHKEKISEHTS